jgi:outer membrane autotransporter protein
MSKIEGKAKRQARAMKTSPMTRAVRIALAASAVALGLGTGSTAFAAGGKAQLEASLPQMAMTVDPTPVVDLTVVSGGMSPAAAMPAFAALAIDESGPGDVTIYNSDPISETDVKYSVAAISGYSEYGTVSITNTADGELYAGSIVGDAIGIYGYSLTGDVSIDNAGAITTYSYAGLADGIFASGANVEVANSGAIETYGYTWSAGIEAESSDSTTVINSGDITASAGEAYFRYDGFAEYIGAAQGGQATGIYATGGAGGVDISNSGNIHVSGGYVAGMDVTATGDITIDNSGSIESGPEPARLVDYSTNIYGIVTVYGAQLADGISATSLGDGTQVSITNSGDIHVSALYGSNGIAATASGYGSTAEVWNTGNIYAGQYFKYGYGAYGIVASADSDATVDNAGTISVVSTGAATGVAALSFAGEAVVTNSGDIDATSRAAGRYASTGLLAFAGNGEARVENDGSVVAVSFGYIGRAIDAQGYSGASVVNDGSLYVEAKYAYGIYAVSPGGDAVVSNGETGEIGFYASGDGSGIFAVGVNGDAIVENAGSIEGQAWGQATGVFGLSVTGDVHLSNTGTIEVATENGAALGLFARAWDGTAYVANSGDIDVSTFDYSEYTNAFGYLTYGILAQGGSVEVTNSGNITVEGEGYAAGIVVSALGDAEVVTTGGSIEVYSPGTWVTYAVYVPPGGGGGGYYGGDGIRSAGDLHNPPGGAQVAPMDGGYGGEYGYYNYYYVLVGAATGIDASAGYGDVTVSNASDITAEAVYVSATGINASALYDVAVTNSGDISASSAYGYATGIDARASTIYLGKYYGSLAFDGTTTVSNSGDITLYAPQQSAGKATGINASRDDGAVVVGNSGDIDIYAGGRSYGIFGFATYGEVSVTNSGDITMLSHTDATIGISASTGNFFFGGGDVSVVNSGDISVHSDYGFANAIGAVAGSVGTPYGDSYIRNSGDLDVFGQYNAAGIQTRASAGNATIINSGDVHVESAALGYVYQPDQTVGIAALTFFGGDLTIQNTGDVTVNGYAMSYGLYAQSFNDGTVRITNAGDVSVHSQYSTDGYVGYFGYDLPPMISRGVFAVDYFGDIIVNNTSTGSIDASGGDIAIGVHTASYSGTVVVNNAGHIHAGDTNFAIGVLMEGVEGTNTLNNAATGVISADGDEGYAFAVMGSYAVDTINNSGRITGAVALYAGDDVFNNRSGGVWDVGGTRSTDFGDGNDSINNFAGGVIHLDDGAIYMGGGTANAFTNLGMIKVSGDTNVIDMGGDGATVNTVALSNVNTISFLDGHSDDALSIVGHLGGTGSLGLDVDLADESSDQLHVEGNMAANAAQRVNIAFAGMPLTASTSIDFAHVSGTSTAGSFVPGQILGYNEARNFLDLDFSIGSRLNTANTAADVFSIELDVVGLNDTGTLAANVASGAAGMLNAQVGTFKQRMGVNPYGDDGKVMSAFFRTYTSEGDVNPAHMAANFGQGGNFAFDQTTWGREVGVNANLHGNVHAGITLGSADGRQRLTGNGVGSNRMDGMTWGVYATWFAPQGFYVDVSGRWMAVDVVSTSAAGQMQSRAHTGAWNVEAGYNWTVGGLNVVPQLQYTRTEVEDVRAIQGDRATFEGHGGTSTRGRLGVEVSKTFESSGLRWTPYGSINAVREFDGEMTYTVADNFHGSTDIEGTSVMAEAGVGVQKGGWGFTIGANWIDGGAFNSTVGGQALVRFAW